MTWRILASAVVAVGLMSGPALACKGTSVLLEDNFRQVDAAWDQADWFSIGAGQAKITPDKGYGLTVFYNGTLFENADMCVDLTMPEIGNPDETIGGVVFWGDDYSNYYGLFVSGHGTAAILRYQNKRWLAPVRWRKVDMKPQAGASNTLRVKMDGNTAQTFINDKPFALIKGAPKQGGSLIGFHAESESAKPDTWIYSNLKITN